MIAWLALAISAATFVWKFVETYIRWPRIGVVMRGHITIRLSGIASAAAFGGEPEPKPPPLAPAIQRPDEKFDVIVVNKGAEAITIANVGLSSKDRSYNIDAQNKRDEGKEVAGPEFPVRVEGHGALRWTIGSELIEHIPRGTKLVGYAYRYRSFRKYPKRWRNPLKMYESLPIYTKN